MPAPRRFPLARLLLLNAVVLVVVTVAVPLRPPERRAPPVPAEAEGARILRSTHPEAAIGALRVRRDARSAAVLRALCDAPDGILRGLALRALAERDPVRSARLVRVRLESPVDTAELLLTLEAALSAPAAEQAEVLAFHARSDDRAVRALALAALAAAGDQGACEELLALADGSDPWEELALAVPLARAGSPAGAALRDRALRSLPAAERPHAERLVAAR